MNQEKIEREYASYKDPDGYVFYKENKVFRKVNSSFVDQYNSLKQSGTYKILIDGGLLIPFADFQNEEGLFSRSKKSSLFMTHPYAMGF